jgi:2-methylisocitrate lyase-like PEP mutase family enzyme
MAPVLTVSGRGGAERLYSYGSVSTQRDKAERFKALHEGSPFVIPNPWDVGSAKVLEALGFPALATCSGAFAFTVGRGDGEVSLAEMVEHAAVLAQATELPVSVDLENGYGPEPDDAAMAITAAAAAGAVGSSIDDFDHSGGIYELGEAVERVAAAAEAAARLDFPFTFTARAENHIRGNPDLDDTVARLQAYQEAGADVLYAPGLRSEEEIGVVCEALARPVNVVALPGLTMAQIFDAGAQRISLGSSLAGVGIEAIATAAEGMRDQGDLSPLVGSQRIREWLRD